MLVDKGFVDKSTLVVVGDSVFVRYGKLDFKAKILKNRGHGFFDVAYSATEKEVAVPIDRISPLVAAFKMKTFEGSFDFPLLIVPVRHRTKSIGIMGLDSFAQVEHAPYDPQPEPGLKLFLEHLVSCCSVCLNHYQASSTLLSSLLYSVILIIIIVSSSSYYYYQNHHSFINNFLPFYLGDVGKGSWQLCRSAAEKKVNSRCLDSFAKCPLHQRRFVQSSVCSGVRQSFTHCKCSRCACEDC
jgi:hypothetical protein